MTPTAAPNDSVGLSAVADMLVALGAVAMAVAGTAALALVLPIWAAALVVGVLLWLAAGVVLLLNRLHASHDVAPQVTPMASAEREAAQVQDIAEMPLWWRVNNRYASPLR